MRKPKPARERAARALCELEDIPPDIKMDGSPMWISYLPEVDAVLQAACCWTLIFAVTGRPRKMAEEPGQRLKNKGA